MNHLHFKYIRFVLNLLASSPGILCIYSPLLVGLTAIGTAVPFATGKFIDALAYHRSPWIAFEILVCLIFLKTALSPILQHFICSRSRKLEADLQFRILDAAMNLHPAQLGTIPDGELVAKLSRDTFAVGGFVRGLYPRLLQTVVMMFAAGGALCVRSFALAAAFMVFFPLAVLLFAPFARRFAENSNRVRRQSDTSFNALFDFFMTLPTLKVLDAEQRFADVPQSAFTQLKDSNNETDALSIHFGCLLGILLAGGEIAVLGIAGSLAAKGTIPVGDVVLYQMLFIMAIQSVEGVLSLLPEFASLREGARSLAEVLERPLPTPGHQRIESLESLSFHHVTFAYPHAPTCPVVKDFSAVFHPGTVVGLSGMNGAGKSTLLKLTVNALEPQQGEILVNGHPFAEIDLDDFRRRLGIVFQDNLLVNGTIRDNITLRNPVFSAKDIEQALVLSGFDAVVKRFPNGLDTRIGNQIRNLSGGERQRLALARAIVRDPMVLVLDEATNHLDATSRKKVAKLITYLRPGRLILLAGHDPELDKLCDVKISCQI